MPPRCVLGVHKNFLFYLVIWLSYIISDWKTNQLDYDVPTDVSSQQSLHIDEIDPTPTAESYEGEKANTFPYEATKVKKRLPTKNKNSRTKRRASATSSTSHATENSKAPILGNEDEQSFDGNSSSSALHNAPIAGEGNSSNISSNDSRGQNSSRDELKRIDSQQEVGNRTVVNTTSDINSRFGAVDNDSISNTSNNSSIKDNTLNTTLTNATGNTQSSVSSNNSVNWTNNTTSKELQVNVSKETRDVHNETSINIVSNGTSLRNFSSVNHTDLSNALENTTTASPENEVGSKLRNLTITNGSSVDNSSIKRNDSFGNITTNNTPQEIDDNSTRYATNLTDSSFWNSSANGTSQTENADVRNNTQDTNNMTRTKNQLSTNDTGTWNSVSINGTSQTENADVWNNTQGTNNMTRTKNQLTTNDTGTWNSDSINSTSQTENADVKNNTQGANNMTRTKNQLSTNDTGTWNSVSINGTTNLTDSSFWNSSANGTSQTENADVRNNTRGANNVTRTKIQLTTNDTGTWNSGSINGTTGEKFDNSTVKVLNGTTETIGNENASSTNHTVNDFINSWNNSTEHENSNNDTVYLASNMTSINVTKSQRDIQNQSSINTLNGTTTWNATNTTSQKSENIAKETTTDVYKEEIPISINGTIQAKTTVNNNNNSIEGSEKAENKTKINSTLDEKDRQAITNISSEKNKTDQKINITTNSLLNLTTNNVTGEENDIKNLTVTNSSLNGSKHTSSQKNTKIIDGVATLTEHSEETTHQAQSDDVTQTTIKRTTTQKISLESTPTRISINSATTIDSDKNREEKENNLNVLYSTHVSKEEVTTKQNHVRRHSTEKSKNQHSDDVIEEITSALPPTYRSRPEGKSTEQPETNQFKPTLSDKEPGWKNTETTENYFSKTTMESVFPSEKIKLTTRKQEVIDKVEETTTTFESSDKIATTIKYDTETATATSQIPSQIDAGNEAISSKTKTKLQTTTEGNDQFILTKQEFVTLPTEKTWISNEGLVTSINKESEGSKLEKSTASTDNANTPPTEINTPILSPPPKRKDETASSTINLPIDSNIKQTTDNIKTLDQLVKTTSYKTSTAASSSELEEATTLNIDTSSLPMPPVVKRKSRDTPNPLPTTAIPKSQVVSSSEIPVKDRKEGETIETPTETQTEKVVTLKSALNVESTVPSDKKSDFNPQVKALTADEVQENLKDNNIHQSKNERKQTLEKIEENLQSLCKGLTKTKDLQVAQFDDFAMKAELVIVAGKTNHFFDITSLKNSTVINIQNKFAIGSELENKYKKWKCTDDNALCDSLCLGFSHFISSYVRDILVNKNNKQRLAFRSNVVNVQLINPKTWEPITTTDLSTSVEYKFSLYNSTVKAKFEIECCVYQNEMWDKTACKTIKLTKNSIHCSCNSLGYSSAFMIETIIPTTIPPQVETLAPEMKEKLSNLNKQNKRSLVRYKFEISADYNLTVGKHKQETEEKFKTEIANQLNISKESIQKVMIAPECDDCDLENDTTTKNFTHKVRDLYPTDEGSIQVVVQVAVSSKNNISAEEVHKQLQEKIKNKELILRDKDNNELEINPNQKVGVEIETLDAEDSSTTTAVILGVVFAVLLFFLILLGIAVYKKLKKSKEKILPFNKKLTPYLNPTYKNFHHENTLDGTIESLVRIRRRSDQLLYGFDEVAWKSNKGGKRHTILPANKSWNSSRRQSQPVSLQSTYQKQTITNRTYSPPVPGFVDDNTV